MSSDDHEDLGTGVRLLCVARLARTAQSEVSTQQKTNLRRVDSVTRHWYSGSTNQRGQVLGRVGQRGRPAIRL